MQEKPCYACKGLRLKPEVLAVTVDGKSIMDICNYRLMIPWIYLDRSSLVIEILASPN